MLFAKLPLATAEHPSMSPDAIRTEFMGKKMQGYFHNGRTWTSGYHEGDRFDMCEGQLCVEGRWFFRGRALCFLSGPPHWLLQERCTVLHEISANCYEFHLTSPRAGPRLDEGDFRSEPHWHSLGWRQEEAAACEERCGEVGQGNHAHVRVSVGRDWRFDRVLPLDLATGGEGLVWVRTGRARYQ